MTVDRLYEWLADLRKAVGDARFAIKGHRWTFGEYPNLIFPRRFNEHLIRLKLSRDGRSRLRGEVSDKEIVKQHVDRILGPGFTARTLAVLRSKPEVHAYRFPATCVIKPTHCSMEVIVRDAETSDPDLNRIVGWFDVDFYRAGREPNYRKLEPKVIVEELLKDERYPVPPDYKVFCFEGRPAFIQVDTDRFGEHRRSLFSPNWKELNVTFLYPRIPHAVPRPAQLAEMLDAARRLGQDFSFIRVDFFALTDRLIVGELTNFPENCKGRFTPDSADYQAGRLFRNPELDAETLFGVVGR